MTTFDDRLYIEPLRKDLDRGANYLTAGNCRLLLAEIDDLRAKLAAAEARSEDNRRKAGQASEREDRALRLCDEHKATAERLAAMVTAPGYPQDPSSTGRAAAILAERDARIRAEVVEECAVAAEERSSWEDVPAIIRALDGKQSTEDYAARLREGNDLLERILAKRGARVRAEERERCAQVVSKCLPENDMKHMEVLDRAVSAIRALADDGEG